MEEIKERVGFFHFNLMLTLAGVTGVFLALDLFLFYFFWELMLVPMYFLIDIWGHERRHYAAVKFFIFTQLGGLLMLLAILGLYFVHGHSTGVYTFDYADLLGTVMSPATAMLADARLLRRLRGQAAGGAAPHLAARRPHPGAHGRQRGAGRAAAEDRRVRADPLRGAALPGGGGGFAPVAMALGVAGILYGALLAFAQTDLKRLVAYTSISHLGFVLLGIFAWNELALQGAVMQMIAHGVSTGALFVHGRHPAGAAAHARDGRDGRLLVGRAAHGRHDDVLRHGLARAAGAGQLRRRVPRAAGRLQVSVTFTRARRLGLIAATVYAVWMVQRPSTARWRQDRPGRLGARETATLGVMAVVVLFLGLFPQATFNTASAALGHMQQPDRRPGRLGAPH